MSKSTIRLLIGENMFSFRDYLCMALSHEPDMEIVAIACSGIETVERALATKPDVAILEAEMATFRDGVKAIQTINSRMPSLRSVILTNYNDDNTIYAAFEAGAIDYLLKNSSLKEILEAIRAAANDQSPLRPQIASIIRSEFKALRRERSNLIVTLNMAYRLTPTELKILCMLSEGKNKYEIARLQSRKLSTVKTHIEHIFKKLGAHSFKDIMNFLPSDELIRILLKEV
jgi:DNA-binding NarL/FixJ family response regulator